MKIKIVRIDAPVETEVCIRYGNHPDEKTERLLAQLQVLSCELTGYQEGRAYRIQPQDLYYMEIYIVAKGWAPLSAAAWVKTLLLLLLTVFTNAAISFFIAVFFASANAFSTASIIFGTLIGFLTGIYLPIGMLPEGVQWAIRLFPPSHAAALLRQTLMERVIEARLGALPEQAVTEIKHLFGITLPFGNYEFSSLASCLFLIACALALFSLAAWRLSRQNK